MAVAMAAEDAATDALLERLQNINNRSGSPEILRGVTAKLHSRATSQDTNVRQSTLDRISRMNSSTLITMMSLLETTRDLPTSNNIAGTLRETVCFRTLKALPAKQASKKTSVEVSASSQTLAIIANKNNTSSSTTQQDTPTKQIKKVNNPSRHLAISLMVTHNATSILTRILHQINSRKEPRNINVELLLYDVLWILSQLAQKDPKFAVKVRYHNGTKLIHAHLKNNITNTKVIFPLLNIMKQLSKNPITAGIQIRDGVVGTYEKVLIHLGLTPTARMRLSLDAVGYLSKNKVCCIQMVKSGIIHLIVKIFDRWDNYEGRLRLKICSHILQIFQHICVIKSGRRMLAAKKHIQIFHRFCTLCPDDDSFDRLVSKVCSIVCICLNNKILPVPSISPAVFSIPNINSGEWPTSETNEGDDDYTGSSSDEEQGAEDDAGSQSDSDSLLDENTTNQSPEMLPNGNGGFLCQTSSRDLEDLKRYSSFFKEFSNLQRQLRLIKRKSICKGCLPDSPGNQLSTSVYNLDRTEHSSFFESSYKTSMPSLLSDMDNKVPVNQTFCDNRCKNNETTESLSCALKILRDLPLKSSPAHVYIAVASRVRSIIPFVKVAYPDLFAAESPNKPEFLNEIDRTTFRKKLITCIDRAINPENPMNVTVYDLDALCTEEYLQSNRLLGNADLFKISSRQYQCKKLNFESRFESGNLRKAIQIGPREYDLILMPDVNSSKRHLWFYFEVSNMSSNLSYVFNIVNCEKSDSQFNFGMKPVMFSVKEASLGRPGWVRTGYDVCYYKNSYQYVKSKKPSKCYLTVSFTIEFQHSNDVCYLAYHYPYTYSQTMSKIWLWTKSLSSNIYCRTESLCNSLNNNEIPLLTITADESLANPIQNREIVFLTSRVHPGESNASWVMDGVLSSLLGTTSLSYRLRAAYVFKVVPMLNVEGVINGW